MCDVSPYVQPHDDADVRRADAMTVSPAAEASHGGTNPMTRQGGSTTMTRVDYADARKVAEKMRASGEEEPHEYVYFAQTRDGQTVVIHVKHADGYLDAAAQVTEKLEAQGIFPEHMEWEVLLPYDDEAVPLLRAGGYREAAVSLYRRGRISSLLAAHIAGMPLADFEVFARKPSESGGCRSGLSPAGGSDGRRAIIAGALKLLAQAKKYIRERKWKDAVEYVEWVEDILTKEGDAP